MDGSWLSVCRILSYTACVFCIVCMCVEMLNNFLFPFPRVMFCKWSSSLKVISFDSQSQSKQIWFTLVVCPQLENVCVCGSSSISHSHHNRIHFFDFSICFSPAPHKKRREKEKLSFETKKKEKKITQNKSCLFQAVRRSSTNQHLPNIYCQSHNHSTNTFHISLHQNKGPHDLHENAKQELKKNIY